MDPDTPSKTLTLTHTHSHSHTLTHSHTHTHTHTHTHSHTHTHTHTLINPLTEVCGSPDQAAYYHVLCPQTWTFLSDLALGWYMVTNERFITCCLTSSLCCLEGAAVVNSEEAG